MIGARAFSSHQACASSAAASVKEHDRDEALCRLNKIINAINDKTSLLSPALTV